jgi:outer membrane protein OmpA-like peptidoglycan-associated protein
MNKYTEEVIPNADITLYDEDKNPIASLKTNDLGLFSYNLDCLKQTYSIEGSKNDFYKNSIEFTIISNVTQTTKVTLELEPTPAPVGTDLTVLLSLKPIFFDFDEAFIREDAQIELAKVISYMERYPTVKVDIRSHTDSRGTHEYNIELSENRNKRTQEYILRYGNISHDRLTGQGYGEFELTNHCSDDVICTRKEHQANRRSEFIIIGN